MSEKRKPDYTFLLRKEGNDKSNKVEMFHARHWIKEPCNYRGKYRLRVNGQWWPKGEKKFITTTEIKELVFRSIKLNH